MSEVEFITVSYELEGSGLVWHPEIGDEICNRAADQLRVSILFDPQGLTPGQLRESFLWLPTVEQLVVQIEARQAMLYHAGISESLSYETVIKTNDGYIEAAAPSLRTAIGKALNNLLTGAHSGNLH